MSKTSLAYDQVLCGVYQHITDVLQFKQEIMYFNDRVWQRFSLEGDNGLTNFPNVDQGGADRVLADFKTYKFHRICKNTFVNELRN